MAIFDQTFCVAISVYNFESLLTEITKLTQAARL